MQNPVSIDRFGYMQLIRSASGDTVLVMENTAASAIAEVNSGEGYVYQHEQQHKFNFVAPVAAFIFPGLGHWILGYRRRGRLIAVGVIFLYLSGLLIGGISVIDYSNAPWWFYGQCLNGPVTPLIYVWYDKHRAPADPSEVTNYIYPKPSFSHMNEMGTLYTTLAGMLNLIAILDVIYLAPAIRRSRGAFSTSSNLSSDRRGDDKKAGATTEAGTAAAAATGGEGQGGA